MIHGFVVNIEAINRKHIIKTDCLYRVGYGLKSRLLDFNNGIFYLEVIFGSRWHNNYSATVYELAHCWKDNNPELEMAQGCKVFIIDGRKEPEKIELHQSGIRVDYDARKGILFPPFTLN
ncbi:MAG: hypothetical protein KA109_16975 [Saprospiraceae bacterium]|nr:hypothetical protein [Saprospiraceae bacterium]MBK6481468.1 hypothetical protein [Saprospiraceae bacterium]MBK6815948.1 hypothetical protein [Saprospiraceae bacterium]MBK7370589.1 hypothetical protein [Saprospiraceae bacterium]MBK7438740.1 hypothetical protein [Saprospiraceae bacterium]